MGVQCVPADQIRHYLDSLLRNLPGTSHHIEHPHRVGIALKEGEPNLSLDTLDYLSALGG